MKVTPRVVRMEVDGNVSQSYAMSGDVGGSVYIAILSATCYVKMVTDSKHTFSCMRHLISILNFQETYFVWKVKIWFSLSV